MALLILDYWAIFVTPEKIRKFQKFQKVISKKISKNQKICCLQGVHKDTSYMKWVKIMTKSLFYEVINKSILQLKLLSLLKMTFM